jgi:hypothetical protein
MKLFHVIAVFGLAMWTVLLAASPLDAAMNSFVHLPNLVFHEAGHIIFSPLGSFMTVLGGSLMQVIIPLVCAGAFLIQQDDALGASICTWWAGENLLDLAPYINDARDLKLMLLGGPADEVEGHDWEAILTTTRALHLDHTIAHATWWLGLAVMAGAIVWAGLTVNAERDPAR